VEQLAAFLAAPANKAVLDNNRIDAEELTHAQRLLALCSLASSNLKPTYAEVAAAVHVSVDDVELLVVDAISCGLVDATLNQMSGTVSFRYV
jgi:transcriptional accessory protein Tex/SPT6